MTRKEREELNALSKEVFGSSSRWQKLVEKGYAELVTEDKEEAVPPAKEGDAPTTRTIKVPVLTSFGAKQSTTKYHTAESVMALMLDYKQKIDEIRAKIKEHQEAAQKAKEEALKTRQAVEDSAGSAK